MQFVKEHLHGSKFKLHPLCNAHTAPARLDKAARRGYNKTSEIFMINDKKTAAVGRHFYAVQVRNF